MIELSPDLWPALKRALRLRGSAPLAFDGTISPVVRVAELDRLPYFDGHVFSFYLDAGPVAAEYATFSLAPPTGHLLVLDRWRPTFSTAIASFFLTFADSSSAAPTANRPARIVRDASQLLPLSTGSTVKAVPGAFTAGTDGNAPAGTFHPCGITVPAGPFSGPALEGPWVATEQVVLWVQCNVANNDAGAWFYGRIVPRG